MSGAPVSYIGTTDERVILAGLREGRAAAYHALYHCYSDRVFRTAVGALGDEAAARDAVQETFVRVFHKVHTFEERSSLGSWIFRIAVNLCLHVLEKREVRARHAELESAPAGVETADPAASPEATAMRRQQLRRLEAVLRGLSAKERLTFLLHYVEEFTADEIAGMLGEGRGTVLKRLQRTRQEIAETLRTAASDRITDGRSETRDARGK